MSVMSAQVQCYRSAAAKVTPKSRLARQNLSQIMCGDGKNDGIADRLNHVSWYLKDPSVRHATRRTELIGDFVA